MASLEHFRKAAKLARKWHREREWTVAEQIRLHLPRFAERSDREIFAADFKLADAQELIARQQGFENWQALKTGLETMSTEPQATAQPTYLLRATPHLYVLDIEAACAFYAEKLGFRVLFKYGEPPFYAVVVRDGAHFNLRRVDEPLMDQSLRDREQYLTANILVSTGKELKQLFADFQAAGVTFLQTLKKQPWGGMDFIVKDPFGNLIDFGTGANL
jgi:catechol 2,3-dioxygenase-like lactoylglutathione lyase family enzyme